MFQKFKNSLENTFFRFLPSCISAILAAGFSVYIQSLDYSDDRFLPYLLVRLILVLAVVYGLNVSIKLFLEARELTKYFYLANVLPLFGLLTFLIFPSNESMFASQHGIYIGVIFLILLALILISPFLNKKTNFHYWIFLNRVILHFLLSVIFTLIIVFGFYLIVWALDFLLKLSIDSEIYGQIFSGVSLGFGGIFLLSGVPTEFEKTKLEEFEYPKIYKILSNYILIPLWYIYTTILFVYSAKILLTWEWPNSQSVPLILVSLISGIFIILLSFNQQIKLIKYFQISYFISTFLLLVVYFLGINFRLEYGITESRYYIILLGIFFFLTALYNLIQKTNLKIYPILFIILALISLIPGISAVDVSLSTQKNQFEKLLSENGILENGKIKKLENESDLSIEIKENIRSKVEFLTNRKQIDYLKKYFPGIDYSQKQNYEKFYDISGEIMKEIGFSGEYYVSSNYYTFVLENSDYQTFNLDENYQKLVIINDIYSNSSNSNIQIQDQFLFINNCILENNCSNKFSQNPPNLPITNRDSSPQKPNFENSDQEKNLKINVLTDKIKEDIFNKKQNYKSDLNLEKMTIFGKIENSEIEYKFIIRKISLQVENDKIQVEDLSGYLFLK